MSNPNTNRIDTQISDTDKTILNDAFDAILGVLDNYSQALTEQERASLFSLQEENLVFAEDAYAQGQLLAPKFPPAMVVLVNFMKSDLGLYQQLDQITQGKLKQVSQRFSDTQRLAAHESYSSAIALYKVIEAMASLGTDGFQASYDVLKTRFANQGGQPPIQNP